MPLEEGFENGNTIFRDPETNVPKVYIMEVAFQEEKSQSDIVIAGSEQRVIFSEPVEVLDFYNGDITKAVFTVNGKPFTVLPGAGYDPVRIGGVPSDTVIVEGTSDFILKRFA